MPTRIIPAFCGDFLLQKIRYEKSELCSLLVVFNAFCRFLKLSVFDAMTIAMVLRFDQCPKTPLSDIW